MKKWKYYIIGFITMLSSCELETTWKIESFDRVAVVDAIITSEDEEQQIRIYYSTSELNQSPEPISGVNVLFTDGTNFYPFYESNLEPGLYLSPSIPVAVNTPYALILEYEGFSDTAYAYMTAVSNLKPAIYAEEDNLRKYVDPGSDLPAMTEIYYDWSSSAEYCDYYGSCTATEVYYSMEIVDIINEFAPDKQQILIPRGTTVYRKKYSLTEEHQEFIRSLLIETEWRGGLFDVEHGNIPTNFVNGTRGWFAVCNVLMDSHVVP